MSEVKEKFISCQRNARNVTLFRIIPEIEGVQDIGNQGTFHRAATYISRLDEDVAKKVLVIAAKSRIKEDKDIENLGSSIKFRINPELHELLIRRFRSAFDIVRVKQPFLVWVTLMAYYNHIREENKKLGVYEELLFDCQSKVSTRELTDLDRMTILVCMMQAKSSYIDKIDEIITNWMSEQG